MKTSSAYQSSKQLVRLSTRTLCRRKQLTNNSKLVRSIWIDLWRRLKPELSIRTSIANLVIVLGVILETRKKLN